MDEKVYAYLRVSSTMQTEGDGFQRQLKAIKKYAKQNKMMIVKVYEEDETGTIADRAKLAELIVDLESNGVRTVLIEQINRLARDLLIQESIIKDFQKRGFNLISVVEGQDLLSADPTRKLIRQVLGAFAEYDKTMLVARLKVAKDRIRKQTGRCEGVKPYGHFEGEMEIQKFCRYARRQPKNPKQRKRTFREIAEALNEQGFLTRQGKDWNAMLVRNVIIKKGMGV